MNGDRAAAGLSGSDESLSSSSLLFTVMSSSDWSLVALIKDLFARVPLSDGDNGDEEPNEKRLKMDGK